MIDKKASYLNERVYAENEKGGEINPEILLYWSELLGENFLSDIREYNVNVMNALLDNEYRCDEACQDRFNELGQIEKISVKKNSEIISKMNNQLFFEFYKPFYEIALTYYDSKKVENPIINDSDNEIKKCLLEILGARFEKVATRVLLLELNICREEGLAGNTEEEKYITYTRDYLSNADYQNEILDVYPCLKRIMFESISMLVVNVLEVIQNICNDKKLIEEQICSGKNFNHITRIKSEFSDSHNRGKAVFNIDLDNKSSIIYKPHSLECELAYQKLLDWITEECGDTALNYKIIDRRNYGWEEKIEYKSCKNKNEVLQFYKRIGYILFANYLLQVTDIHYENIIAYGSYPVVIDLETIMTNMIEGRDNKTAKEIAYEKIGRSVISQGLLPKYVWGKGDKAGIDISGISGVAGQELPVKIPVLKNIKRADMHIEYEHPHTREQKNIPKLGNKFIMNEECTQQILEGFSSAYSIALSHKSELGEKTSEFRNLTVRFIPRDTRQYTMLLQTSYHPDFMLNGVDRELLISSLYPHNEKELSLLKIYDKTGDLRYYETAQRAILYENTLYKEETNNWLDMRIFNGVEVKNLGDPVSWCHGASGILLSRIKILPYVKGTFRKIIESDIKKATKKILSNGIIQMQCLCHGNIGNIDILLETARALENRDLENYAKNILEKSVAEGIESGWKIGLTGKETNVGFMLGLSGIGYSLLRFRFPGVFPSILSVEI